MSPPSSPSAALSASAPPCVTVAAEDGQDQWFANEVKPHEPALRAYLSRKYPALGDVDDVVQESFLKALKFWRTGKLTSVKGFLFAAANNFTIDRFRRRKFTAPIPVCALPERHVLDDDANVVETVCSREELALVAEAIAGLPERCRQVMVQRVVQGRACGDIANALGISEGTVRVHLGHGMKRCQAFFRERRIKLEQS
jgi:RNA polymerase sigma factor (sigma-70 family)